MEYLIPSMSHLETTLWHQIPRKYSKIWEYQYFWKALSARRHRTPECDLDFLRTSTCHVMNLNNKWRKSLRSSTLWLLKQVRLDGDWRRLKTFIILMMDISHTLLASTTLTILHLTLIANLERWKSFLTSRVSPCEADLKVEEAGNECGQESAKTFLFARLKCQYKPWVMAYISTTHTPTPTHTSPLRVEYEGRQDVTN